MYIYHLRRKGTGAYVQDIQNVKAHTWETLDSKFDTHVKLYRPVEFQLSLTDLLSASVPPSVPFSNSFPPSP